ncbi:sulfite exporter TauE/SafE family protein [Desertibaculum subflavum]|uniref:sulfite exporter TauE/SafE family protein n=1 Tax=Desertibaculum subflavum TaxID=2268458 RepID=UPI000E671B0F
MFQLYLPIAEVSVNILILLGLGLVVGFLSGMFGVGGGFLMTPTLIFFGVPPAVAVSTQAPQILASSFSGMLAHFRRDNVDLTMGAILTLGGLVGSIIGVWLFALLRRVGQIDLVIGLTFAILLGAMGSLMMAESTRTILNTRRANPKREKLHKHYLLHRLPLKIRFRKSRLYISVALPLLIGLFVGVLVAIMGIGGGFILVPAMIFLLGMPTLLAIGTSLFHIVFVTANTTFLHAMENQTVDIPLALLLTIGGVIGAQLGAGVGARLKAVQLRGLLGLMVLAVAAKVIVDLVATPIDLYSIGRLGS